MKLDHKKLYAFVCPETGHGLLSVGDSIETQKPLVFMSKELAIKMIPQIKEVFSGHGKSIELREFTMSEMIEVVCDR